jgi:two-component system, response regulator YesN
VLILWKLLIAEDETTIRKGLRHAVDWDVYSISIVGEAEDGEIALEMAIELKPHIIFVDINMPFLNGIELMKQLRKHLPETIFIVISGYDEFSYAQQAIKMDAFDYLLKPVNNDELEKTVKNATEQLEKNSRNKQREWQLDGNKPLLKEKFLQGWSMGATSAEEVSKQYKLLDFKLEGNVGLVIYHVVREIGDSGTEQNWSDILISFSIKNIIKDILKTHTNMELFEDQEGNIVVLIPNIELEELMSRNREIKDFAEKFLKKVIVCLETMLTNYLDFPSQYNSLKEEIKLFNRLSPMVVLAKDYIDHHYNEHTISLHHVADIVQVSPTYLSKKIKTELGVSFINYLTKVRINKALMLIKDPYLKVYEIAEMVGYSTQHYFCNSFKKETGISPTVYRSGVKGYD